MRRLIDTLRNLIGRLRVGQKLLLIYALDFTAVIAVSALLIQEEYLSIDFARQEQQGVRYIQAMTPPLLAAADTRGSAGPGDLGALQVRLARAERACGMAGASDAWLSAMQRWQASAPPADSAQLRREALRQGVELARQVGNQSKLILDPDLRTYYAMSIVVLRLPELLVLSEELVTRVHALDHGGPDVQDADRQRLWVLEGEIDAVAKGLLDDLAAAQAVAPDDGLSRRLAPALKRVAEALELLQRAVHAALQQHGGDRALMLSDTEGALLAQMGSAWGAGAQELDRLLQQRADELFLRMGRHAGLMVAMLLLILGAVTFVARQIVLPIHALALTMRQVRETNNYGLRASWSGRDELRSLVDGFNAMLVELGQARSLREEIVAARRAAQAQRELVDAIPIPLLITSMDDQQVLHANQPGHTWIDGERSNPWRRALGAPAYANLMRQLAERTELHEVEVQWHGSQESTAWAVLSARRLQYCGTDAVLTTFSPINQIKQMEARLALWSCVFEASSEGIVVADARMRILSVNRALCRAIGYTAEALIGRPCHALLAEEPASQQVRAFREAMKRDGVWHGELVACNGDGRHFPIWLGISEVRDAEQRVSHHILTMMDISERKTSEERIAFMAKHDALTGLPNRTLCTERLRQAIDQAARDKSRVAVLFMDLDRFKTINDSLGHLVGDALLRSVAQRLTGSLRKEDTVARLGGDEFVMVLPGLGSASEASDIIERGVLRVMQEPHRLPDCELRVGCSVGVAMYPDHGDDIDVLMRRADLAMYAAKNAGRGTARFFTPALDNAAQERLQIESGLQAALERNELELHYQPRVDIRSGRLVSVEALIRWRHPVHDWVSPSRFIPVAEESGLILPIGAWVIQEACRQLDAWKGTALADIGVSINLSAVQLCNARLLELLGDALQRHQLRPELIELELTESTLMHGTVPQQLHALKALGVELAVDDFGTGYSSLSYLGQLPVDKIKIDRSFVAPLCGQSSARAILDAIVSMGHTLGLKVVAEGVEDGDTAQALRASQCDQMQGFHIAKPMAPERLIAWLGVPQVGVVRTDAVAAAQVNRVK